MTVENPDGQHSTWGATALHLLATFVLFAVLNFAIGTAWVSIAQSAPRVGTPNFSMSGAFYGFLTYGVALWLALEGPRFVISRSMVGVVAAVGVALCLAGLLIRGWALISIFASLGPGDQDVRNEAFLSFGIVGFQTLCSLAAIWLFYARHKEDRTSEAQPGNQSE